MLPLCFLEIATAQIMNKSVPPSLPACSCKDSSLVALPFTALLDKKREEEEEVEGQPDVANRTAC